MSTSTIDYDALAQKHGAAMDYDALAEKHGAVAQTPPDNSIFGGLKRRVESTVEGLAKTLNPVPSMEEMQNPVSSTLAAMPGGIALYRLGKGFAEGEKQAGQQTAQQFRQANATKGDTVVKGLQYARAATTAASMVDPFATPTVTNVNRLQDQGRNREAIGQAIPDTLALAAGSKTLGGQQATEAVLSKAADIAPRAANALRNNPVTNAMIGPKPEAIPAEDAFIKATKPRNSIQNINTHVDRALPDARRAADSLGIDVNNMTLTDAEKAVVQAKKDVWTEFEQQHLGPNQKVAVDATPVANRIKAVADDMTSIQKRRMGNVVDDIKDSASDYQGKHLQLGEIEDRIQELNNQLRSQQSQFKVNEQALRNDPKFAHQFAELDGLRQLERESFDNLSGPGSAELKQRYGSLKVLEDVIDRRIPVVERQNPAGLYETAGRLQGLGDIATGVIGRDVGKIASGAVKMRVGQNAQMLNNPDFLIQQAFSKTAPRGPIPAAPPPFAPKGLLPAGPIQLPSHMEPIEPGPEGLLPAQRIISRGPNGQMRVTYGTAVDQGKPIYNVEPKFAYRVRDVGDTGIMPKGHAQATLDQAQAKSYMEGRGQAQNSAQELVRVDLSKLDPKEYTLKTGPGGKKWVQFKHAIPESFIERVH